jgi:uncharacterized protein with PIN domain
VQYHRPGRDAAGRGEYHAGVGQAGPEFVCDAMLGGLARWLRAAGYDAEFTYGIDDQRLIRRVLQTGAALLSSDGKLFDRNLIKDKTVKALFVPRELSKHQQLGFVLRQLKLPVRSEPRCMACGGRLAEVQKQSVEGEAPRKAYDAYERFWRCGRCGKLLWQGTHWKRITARLEQISGGAKQQ